MKGLMKIIGAILAMLGLSSLASSKKKVAVKKIDAKKKVVKKKVKNIDKELKSVKKKQTKAKKTVKRKPVKNTKEAEKFLKDFADKK